MLVLLQESFIDAHISTAKVWRAVYGVHSADGVKDQLRKFKAIHGSSYLLIIFCLALRFKKNGE